MAIIALIGKLSVRKYNVVRALSLSAFIMVLFNPMILLYDPSFELSFGATLGLIIFSTKVSNWLKKIPNYLGLKEVLVSTISAQIAVVPIIVYLMGNFSVISLVSNILVLPFIPISMLLSTVPSIFYLISTQFIDGYPMLNSFIAFPGYLVLKYILITTNFFGSLGFSSINIPPIHFGIVIFIYFLYIPLFFIKKEYYFTILRKLSSTLCQFKFKKKSSI